MEARKIASRPHSAILADNVGSDTMASRSSIGRCGHVKHSTSGRHRLLTENVSGNFLIWG